jgi:general secretion pathway protein G
MELLVTTGILAVLVTLILPAVNRTIESSHTAGCASNLSQIGKAMFAYATDNDGRLPAADDNSKAWPFRTYMFQLNPYLGNLPTVTFEQQLKICFNGVFHCPGKKDWSLSGPTDKQRNSYGMNTFDTNYALNEGPKLAAIEKPAKTVLVADMQADGYWALRNAHYMYKDFKALRHNKTDNILFCDGHVEAMPKDSFSYKLVLE